MLRVQEGEVELGSPKERYSSRILLGKNLTTSSC